MIQTRLFGIFSFEFWFLFVICLSFFGIYSGGGSASLSLLDPPYKTHLCHMNIREFILDLYRQIDAEVSAAGPRCEASGRCCRFKAYGHKLYLTSLEAEILLADAPAYDQPVDEAGCPFQVDNLCTAREPRPMGCRIYFCDPDYQETANKITEKYLARLRQVVREHDLEWEYAPLHHFLNNGHLAPSSETISQSEDTPQRTSLPLINTTSPTTK